MIVLTKVTRKTCAKQANWVHTYLARQGGWVQEQGLNNISRSEVTEEFYGIGPVLSVRNQLIWVWSFKSTQIKIGWNSQGQIGGRDRKGFSQEVVPWSMLQSYFSRVGHGGRAGCWPLCMAPAREGFHPYIALLCPYSTLKTTLSQDFWHYHQVALSIFQYLACNFEDWRDSKHVYDRKERRGRQGMNTSYTLFTGLSNFQVWSRLLKRLGHSMNWG